MSIVVHPACNPVEVAERLGMGAEIRADGRWHLTGEPANEQETLRTRVYDFAARIAHEAGYDLEGSE